MSLLRIIIRAEKKLLLILSTRTLKEVYGKNKEKSGGKSARNVDGGSKRVQEVSTFLA